MKTFFQKQNLIKLALDLIIFIGFLIGMEPRLTGIAIHEWLTVAGTAVFITHLLLNWRWIVEITRRFLSKASGNARVNYILNWLLFIDGVLIMLTGLMISEAVLPALGLRMSEKFIWRGLHSVTADLFIPILGLHVALHWRWIVNTTRRCLLGLWQRRSKTPSGKQEEAQA